MSMVNLGSAVAAGVAGSSLAQRHSSATDQAAHDANVHQRKVDGVEKAVRAEGVGSNDEEAEHSGERDADGRRAWEWNLKNRAKEKQLKEKSIDPSGQTGNTLDFFS